MEKNKTKSKPKKIVLIAVIAVLISAGTLRFNSDDQYLNENYAVATADMSEHLEPQPENPEQVQENDSEDVTSSYTFGIETTSSNYATESRYMCLSGEETSRFRAPFQQPPITPRPETMVFISLATAIT